MTLSARRCPPLSCRTSPPQGGDWLHGFDRAVERRQAAVQSPLRGDVRPSTSSGQRGATWSACCNSCLCLSLVVVAPAQADEAALRTIIAKFATAKGFPAIEAVVRELGATGDPLVQNALTALSEGDLSVRKADSQVFIVKEAGANVSLLDPISGAPAGEAAKTELTKVKVNNGLRAVIRDVLGTLTLGSPDPSVRLAAAENMFRNPDPAGIAALDAAIAKETDARVKARLEQARASAVLVSDLSEADKLAAIEAARRTRRPRGAVAAHLLRGLRRRRAEGAPRPRRSPASTARWRCGRPARTSGTASRSARCCCWRPSVLPSPSASWASSTWRMARW